MTVILTLICLGSQEAGLGCSRREFPVWYFQKLLIFRWVKTSLAEKPSPERGGEGWLVTGGAPQGSVLGSAAQYLQQF